MAEMRHCATPKILKAPRGRTPLVFIRTRRGLRRDAMNSVLPSFSPDGARPAHARDHRIPEVYRLVLNVAVNTLPSSSGVNPRPYKGLGITRVSSRRRAPRPEPNTAPSNLISLFCLRSFYNLQRTLIVPRKAGMSPCHLLRGSVVRH